MRRKGEKKTHKNKNPKPYRDVGSSKDFESSFLRTGAQKHLERACTIKGLRFMKALSAHSCRVEVMISLASLFFNRICGNVMLSDELCTSDDMRVVRECVHI
ncbi:hypothetical protein CEXT_572481 [Caerostris extrusa]|uniref:Uncharacterized protein n=1 Tax=Caerostris extrusa TaxID=172846 RepID=A0AAV4NF48_CAEEX|nr:hypothetical protein CEXT_572481 [Caerostris extrusa]